MATDMKAVRNRGQEIPEQLEYQLHSFLGPVQPNPEFVRRLRSRLTSEPAVILERRNTMAALVVAGLGLFGGALVVWMIFLIRSLLIRGTTSAVN